MNEVLPQLLLESVPKWAAGLGVLAGEISLLVASIVVVVGLYGESKADKWAPPPARIKSWHKIFVAAVTIGVAAELIADGDIFLFSHRLQTIQATEVATLNRQTELLRGDNLALEKILTPRHWLSAAYRGSASLDNLFDREMIRGKIAKFPGTVALIQVVPEFEAERLANEIVFGLEALGWQPRLISPSESGVPPLLIPEGVELWTQNVSAAESLNASFVKEGIWGADGKSAPIRNPSSPERLGPIPKPPEGAVFISIGSNPATFAMWQRQGERERKSP